MCESTEEFVILNEIFRIPCLVSGRRNSPPDKLLSGLRAKVLCVPSSLLVTLERDISDSFLIMNSAGFYVWTLKALVADWT